MAREARLRDVAEAAGVDASVVSRVLSGDARLSIRPETRQRVLDAVSRLDYRPNTAARTLKTARTMAIGMVVPSLADVNYAAMARGAEERATSAGYVLLVATGSASERLADLHGRVDGLLLGTATSGPAPPGVADGRIPTVLMHRREPWGIPSVTVDDERAGYLATEHLLGLGHRRVGHVAGPADADTSRRRANGYAAALAAAGIEPDPALVAHASYDEAGGRTAATRLLERDPAPSALFVTTVHSALGAVAAARGRGLRVPDDVSIATVHDAPFASFVDPPLTTVRMPLPEMGRVAMANLLALLAGEEVGDVLVDGPVELVVRASTASVRQRPKRSTQAARKGSAIR